MRTGLKEEFDFVHTELEEAINSQKEVSRQPIPNVIPCLMRKPGAGKSQSSGIDEMMKSWQR